jgi:hypothetical protein
MLVPDLPVAGPVGSLRRLSRDGVLVLAAPGALAAVPADSLAAVAAELAPIPVRVAEMAELTVELPGLLGARDGEWWVVRPDGHVAAVVDEPARLRAALRRAVGLGEVQAGGTRSGGGAKPEVTRRGDMAAAIPPGN